MKKKGIVSVRNSRFIFFRVIARSSFLRFALVAPHDPVFFIKWSEFMWLFTIWLIQCIGPLFAITPASSAPILLRSSVYWIRQHIDKWSVVKPTWLPSSYQKASLCGHERLKDRAGGKRVVRRMCQKKFTIFKLAIFYYCKKPYCHLRDM